MPPPSFSCVHLFIGLCARADLLYKFALPGAMSSTVRPVAPAPVAPCSGEVLIRRL